MLQKRKLFKRTITAILNKVNLGSVSSTFTLSSLCQEGSTLSAPLRMLWAALAGRVDPLLSLANKTEDRIWVSKVETRGMSIEKWWFNCNSGIGFRCWQMQQWRLNWTNWRVERLCVMHPQVSNPYSERWDEGRELVSFCLWAALSKEVYQ